MVNPYHSSYGNTRGKAGGLRLAAHYQSEYDVPDDVFMMLELQPGLSPGPLGDSEISRRVPR
jgi:hypothetical protein